MTARGNGADRHRMQLFWQAAGIVLMFGVWQIMAMTMPRLAVASPAETFAALARMAVTEAFRRHLAASVLRIGLGVGAGSLAGFALGLAAGRFRPVKFLLEPLRWTLMSVPAVVLVVVAMLWFGMGSRMVVFITAVLLAPIVYVNTVKGFELVDGEIVEMARMYRFTGRQMFRHVYVPALTGPLASAMTIVVGTGVRIVVLAEVLGTANGIGSALSLARSTLDIPAVFAWLIVCILIVAAADHLILLPIQRRALRWKEEMP